MAHGMHSQDTSRHPTCMAANSTSPCAALVIHCAAWLPACLQLEEFYTSYAAFPKVVAWMRQNWAPVAEKWAWWGRLDILDMEANTNNLVERWFERLKYTDLNRNTQSTIHELLVLLVHQVAPNMMQQRAMQLAGRASSGQVQHAQRLQRVVEELVASGAVAQPAAGGAPGLTRVQCSSGTSLPVCVGDLSCGCSCSGECGGDAQRRVVCLHGGRHGHLHVCHSLPPLSPHRERPTHCLQRSSYVCTSRQRHRSSLSRLACERQRQRTWQTRGSFMWMRHPALPAAGHWQTS